MVFNGKTKSQEVVVVNRGNTVETYDIGIENKRFDDQGEGKTVTEAQAGENFADSMLRLSAHEITVNPGESQVVRILLRKSPDLKDGEYRSHLVVRGQPKEDAPIVSGGDDKGVSVKLIPIYGLSIPVIVQQGELSDQLDVKDIKVVSAAASNQLELTIARLGTRSAFLDVSIYGSGQKSGEAIAVLKGLSIYAPLNERHVRVRLTPDQMAKLGHAPNRVIWQELDALNQPIGKPEERTF